MGYSHRDVERTSKGRMNSATQPPTLVDRVRDRMRRMGMARRTEDVYLEWIMRFILANAKRHPEKMGGVEVEAFLTKLAIEAQVVVSTQNQALSALLFLYREVLGSELPWMENIRRAKRPERIQTVLTRDQVRVGGFERFPVVGRSNSLLLANCFCLRGRRRRTARTHGSAAPTRAAPSKANTHPAPQMA